MLPQWRPLEHVIVLKTKLLNHTEKYLILPDCRAESDFRDDDDSDDDNDDEGGGDDSNGDEGEGLNLKRQCQVTTIKRLLKRNKKQIFTIVFVFSRQNL